MASKSKVVDCPAGTTKSVSNLQVTSSLCWKVDVVTVVEASQEGGIVIEKGTYSNPAGSKF